MSHVIGRLDSAFGERYEVEREVGRGGMATVYLAVDRVRERQVAIKLLHPDLAMALGAERFRREIEIERQLDHPHILPIFDSGGVDGSLYYTMPFVTGESLRDRLDREGQLPVEEAVRIACEAADALDFAHQRGIVHRDIKPENILLEDGRVLIADFGIARALTANENARLTQTGIALGTPLYMSPEQSFAERDLDGRSDLYSLACVLYEMLAGQPPFTGPNSQAIAARHLMEEVPSIAVVRPSVSDEIEDLILRALAKSRADRHVSTGEFAKSLREITAGGRATDRRTVATRRLDASRLGGRRRADPRTRRLRMAAAGIGVAALLGVGGTGVWYFGRPAPFAEAAKSRVAVLYFRDASDRQNLGYLADGLTEALISGMTAANLDVVPRNGVLPYRDGAQPPIDVANALLSAGDTVGLLIDGAVTERDGAARVTVRLTDPGDATKGDSRIFDFPLDSAGSGQVAGSAAFDRIEAWLRQRIGQQVTLSSQRSAAGSDAAWTLLQRAEFDHKRGEAAWERGDTTGALRAFAQSDSLAAQSADRAPNWPEPRVLRGRLAFRRADMLAQTPDEAKPLLTTAADLARQAYELDPQNADALALRGAVIYSFVQAGLTSDTAGVRARVDSAARMLEAATKAAPNNASAWVRLSEVRYRLLDRIGARDAARSAYEADAYLTNAQAVLWRLFATSYDLGEAADAEQWCRTAQARFPDDPRFLQCELLLMTMRGARPDITRGWQIVNRLDEMWAKPRRPFQSRWDRMLLAAALGRAGLADSARHVAVAARADRTVDPRGELRGLEAFARTVIGDRNEALTLLEGYLHEFPEHREGFRRLNSWWWQDIQNEPRYIELMRGS